MTSRARIPTKEYLASVLEMVTSGQELNRDSIVALGDINYTDGTIVDASLVGDILDAYSGGATIADFDGVNRGTLESVYSLARSKATNGQLGTAQSLLQYLCIHDHLNPRNWLALGKVQLLQKKYSDAQYSFHFGAVLDMDNPHFPLNSAVAHLRMNNLKEARSGLEHAERLSNIQNPPDLEVKKEIKTLKEALKRRKEED